MARYLHAAFAIVLAALWTSGVCLLHPKLADATEPVLEDQVKNTTFVWLKENASAEEFARSFTSFAHLDYEKDVTALYPGLRGFAIHVPLSQMQTLLTSFEKEAKTKSLAEQVLHLEPDRIAHVILPLKAPCQGPVPLSNYTGGTPWGVAHIGGPLPGDFSKKNVWIIDGGVDNSSGLIAVDTAHAVTCMSGKMCASGDTTDTYGHGTMVAGIIAAKQGKAGFVGVAPGANVIPVKIYDDPKNFDLQIAMKGVDYVWRQNPAGDVVNISWGATANLDAYDDLDEKVLRLADVGAKVVVAAGNLSNDAATAATQGGGYVQRLSPARVGSYSSSSGGLIMTVSASDSGNQFWFFRPTPPDLPWGSFFGNGSAPKFGDGPPTYAEPGVNITSLWVGNTTNTCSGTSFAAPHLAGILLYGMPAAGPHAANDPDDQILPGDPSGANKDDPVGVCFVGNGSCQAQR